MRTCIIGGGLAGSLLAWRLAHEPGAAWVDLLLGGSLVEDATEASGGITRGYESEAAQRELATESITELLDSPVLRSWSGFRRTGSVYVKPSAAGLASEIAGLPGAELADLADLEKQGWRGLPDGSAAVIEPEAGHLSPARLRQALLAELAHNSAVTVFAGEATGLTLRDASISVTVGGRVREYDTVVVAAGPWTPSVLGLAGLDTSGYRTKSIQYSVYPVGDWRPPLFVDEATSLYSKPYSSDSILLGLATSEWNVPPGLGPVDLSLQDAAAALAAERFPELRLGPARQRVSATDCYTDPPILALRQAAGGHRLFTFTGGSGGAAKTALAASRRAATRLAEASRKD
ncbi:NAD(P)/FAD-dependent oxidoreductase [Longispora albida]|uniref:NAD(P)/FAD-dependent oxidoreductase n=1 Tax=Longispora albida TaxID=203523 RepID=UPI00036061BF|nr:FAD-binding oxidoreductase [Longispora albida]